VGAAARRSGPADHRFDILPSPTPNPSGDDVPSKDEVRGWSRLIAGVADQVIAGTVQDMHRAISDGTFRWLGPVGAPLKEVYDAVTGGVYGVVRASIRGAGEVGALAAEVFGSDEPEPPSPVALKARAIAHGVVSDELIALAPELDLDLSFRLDGRDVPVDEAGLAAGYPDARGRVAVFVHGLVDTEAVWHARPEAGPTLPDIAARHGVTPVLVRYGSGRAVGRNGAMLADQLQRLVTHWPVPVTELTIIGHSMGGLLARSACEHAAERGHTWTEPLADVVYLGTPHLGSWLEKVANVGSWTLRRNSRSAPIGALLDERSRGIKDLRFGTIREDAWGETPIDDLLTGLVPDGPWLDEVTHHLVVGRLGAGERHVLRPVLGDALVRAGSAAGTGRRRRIGAGGEVVVRAVAASHTRLVRAPEVATVVHDLLAGAPPWPAASGTIPLRPATTGA
jgi:triacylglycerol lipase